MLTSFRKTTYVHRGFTLIEALVVIVVIAILAGLMLPALQAARETANQASAKSIARSIRYAFEKYVEEHNGDRPADLFALIEATYLKDDLKYQKLSDGRIVSNGYVFELTLDITRIHELLAYLQTLGDKGQEIADALGSAEYYRFLIFARPVVPGKTGCWLIFVDHAGTTYTINDPNCEDIQAEVSLEIQREGLKSVAALLVLGSLSAGDVLPSSQDAETQELAFDLLDANDDGRTTVSELRRFAVRQQAPALSEDETTPLSVLQDYMRFVFDAMEFGAGGEQVDDLGVTNDMLQGDPTVIYSSDNYRLLIEDLVWNEGVADSLSVKVRAAEQARLRWEQADPETRDDEAAACAYSVEAFRQELWTQEGKSIGFEDALLLDAVVGVLCPQVEEPLD